MYVVLTDGADVPFVADSRGCVAADNFEII